jgi:hypothetical protein
MGMTEVRGRAFTGGEPVQTDDTKFIDCTFESVQFRYAGGRLPSFEGCSFSQTGWYFEDSALRTIQLLQAFAHQDGGRPFIDQLFKPGNFIGE